MTPEERRGFHKGILFAAGQIKTRAYQCRPMAHQELDKAGLIMMDVVRQLEAIVASQQAGAAGQGADPVE